MKSLTLYQNQILSKFKGRGLLQVTGQSDLSNMVALKRLLDDLSGFPVSDLVLSEGTVYGKRYYCIEPVGGSWTEMENWCYDTFGDSNKAIWSEVPHPDRRWYTNNRKFWFRDEKDRDWFILKWR